ncbi:MAG: hypothetical protein ABIG30_00960 [Candidatus Aenigmatarchaeota archaeon]
MKKLLSLISGGIDSPVASYLMHKQDYQVDFIFFFAEPFMDKSNMSNVSKSVCCLEKIMKKKSQLFIVPYGPVLSSIAKECPQNLRCILCRRMMFRISSSVAKSHGYQALVTGENLAQVASQTLDNMVLAHTMSKIPILNPLLCFDKVETTNIAEKIGTLDIAKEHRCCGLVPHKPRTKGRFSEVVAAERALDIKKLVKDAVKGIRII